MTGMWRLVDIAGERRHLSLRRNAMVVRAEDEELGRLHLADINAVVVHAHQATVTTNLAAALAEHNIPLVLCDAKHLPASILWPFQGHFEQADRIEGQAAASLPTKKRLWQSLVKAKIKEQARSLADHDPAGERALLELVRKVRSGDPDNVEARAARLYWPRMLGPDFRRDTGGEGLNAPLNYGYIVLRSAMARAVAASGLTPAIGLHHRNRLNPFRLVDDLLEPFRPFVDRRVRANRAQWQDALTPAAKASLAGLLTSEVRTADGMRPIYRIMGAVAFSLTQVFIGDRRTLDLPEALIQEPQMDLGLSG